MTAYEEKAAKAMRILEAGFDDVTAILSFPEKYRKRLRTTNSVERLNEEVRRRERVIRIFPNRESVIRLIGALLMEQDEKWASGKKYLDMAESTLTLANLMFIKQKHTLVCQKTKICTPNTDPGIVHIPGTE